MNAAKRLIPVVMLMVAVAMVVSSQPAHGGAPVDLNNAIFVYDATSKAKVTRKSAIERSSGGRMLYTTAPAKNASTRGKRTTVRAVTNPSLIFLAISC